jgi:MFS family permease
MILCAVAAVAACLILSSASGALFFIAVIVIALGYGAAAGINPVLASDMLGQKYFGTNYGMVLAALPLSSVFFNRLSAAFGQTPQSGLYNRRHRLRLPIISMLVLKHSVKRRKVKNPHKLITHRAG